MKNILLFLLTVASLAAKEHACTDADLFGAYGALSSGFIALSATQIVPFGQVGRFDLDGRGNLEGSVTSSIAGQVVGTTIKGTYVMRDDCTLTARFTNNLNQTFNYSGLYSVDEIRLNQMDAGGVLAYLMKPIARVNGCTQADGEGTFGTTVTGYVILNNNPVPFANVAKVNLQGDSLTLDGNAATPLGGQSIRQIGKLTVNADCTLAATAREQMTGGQQGPESKTIGILLERGREVFLMSSDTNTVLTGTGRRQ